MVIVDKSCFRAYTTLGGKLTVHEWKQVFDPAFGVVVARSRCGRIVDRRVLIQVVTSQPICKRCQSLGAAEQDAALVAKEYSQQEKSADEKKRRRRSSNDSTSP